jgi:NAD(P)-dependent dehydrogenase (short-subunit alcohol dehydrogenase family)
LSGEFDGKRVLVTGGSMGIGREVADELARRGASVLIAARNLAAVTSGAAELPGRRHVGIALDVSDADAWPQAMAEIDAGGELHGLVSAAGVLGPIGALETVDPREFADTIAVNLVGTMLALRFAVPRLRRSRGRAVTFSGGGATAPLPRYDAYAASKAAVVRLTENVAAAYPEISVNCVAPGFVATRMHEQTLRAGAEAAGHEYFERTRAQLGSGGFPAGEAAELVCFLLSDAVGGISGRLLSSAWDPWRDERFRKRLHEEPALGTLRRIDGQFFTRTADS